MFSRLSFNGEGGIDLEDWSFIQMSRDETQSGAWGSQGKGSEGSSAKERQNDGLEGFSKQVSIGEGFYLW